MWHVGPNRQELAYRNTITTVAKRVNDWFRCGGNPEREDKARLPIEEMIHVTMPDGSDIDDTMLDAEVERHYLQPPIIEMLVREQLTPSAEAFFTTYIWGYAEERRVYKIARMKTLHYAVGRIPHDPTLTFALTEVLESKEFAGLPSMEGLQESAKLIEDVEHQINGLPRFSLRAEQPLSVLQVARIAMRRGKLRKRLRAYANVTEMVLGSLGAEYRTRYALLEQARLYAPPEQQDALVADVYATTSSAA